MRALVFVGGELGDVSSADLPQFDLAIAADSGLHHAQQLGVSVDLLIGDMDSVDEARLGDIKTARHPVDKDATDTELAIDYALAQGATEIVVVGGANGRVDHWFAIMLGLANSKWARVKMSALMGTARVYIVRDRIELTPPPGHAVSVIAISNDVTDIELMGLKWSGHFDRLALGSSQGVSNLATGDLCGIAIGSGVVAVISDLVR